MEVIAAGVAAVVGFIVALGVFGWLLPLACFLIIFPLEENERGGWAFFALTFFFVFIYALTGFNVLVAIRDNWKTGVVVILCWFAAGSVWSVFKWNKFTKRFSEDAKKAFSKFVSEWLTALRRVETQPEYYDTDVLRLGLAVQKPSEDRRQRGAMATDPVKDEAMDKARKEAIVELEKNEIPAVLMAEWQAEQYSQRPTPLGNKEKITTWIVFWLWSGIAYVVTEFLSDAIDMIISQLSGIYNSITERNYAGMNTKYFK
ncbi:MAG: hypothetical protein KBD06_01085 [Candidatus Pacebacteria bacterium]|nr:hypothetical protein [Candidatus Paceibacterota bacterium]